MRACWPRNRRTRRRRVRIRSHWFRPCSCCCRCNNPRTSRASTNHPPRSDRSSCCTPSPLRNRPRPRIHTRRSRTRSHSGCRYTRRRPRRPIRIARMTAIQTARNCVRCSNRSRTKLRCTRTFRPRMLVRSRTPNTRHPRRRTRQCSCRSDIVPRRCSIRSDTLPLRTVHTHAWWCCRAARRPAYSCIP